MKEFSNHSFHLLPLPVSATGRLLGQAVPLDCPGDTARPLCCAHTHTARCRVLSPPCIFLSVTVPYCNPIHHLAQVSKQEPAQPWLHVFSILQMQAECECSLGCESP